MDKPNPDKEGNDDESTPKQASSDESNGTPSSQKEPPEASSSRRKNQKPKKLSAVEEDPSFIGIISSSKLIRLGSRWELLVTEEYRDNTRAPGEDNRRCPCGKGCYPRRYLHRDFTDDIEFWDPSEREAVDDSVDHQVEEAARTLYECSLAPREKIPCARNSRVFERMESSTFIHMKKGKDKQLRIPGIDDGQKEEKKAVRLRRVDTSTSVPHLIEAMRAFSVKDYPDPPRGAPPHAARMVITRLVANPGKLKNKDQLHRGRDDRDEVPFGARRGTDVPCLIKAGQRRSDRKKSKPSSSPSGVSSTSPKLGRGFKAEEEEPVAGPSGFRGKATSQASSGARISIAKSSSSTRRQIAGAVANAEQERKLSPGASARGRKALKTEQEKRSASGSSQAEEFHAASSRGRSPVTAKSGKVTRAPNVQGGKVYDLRRGTDADPLKTEVVETAEVKKKSRGRGRGRGRGRPQKHVGGTEIEPKPERVCDSCGTTDTPLWRCTEDGLTHCNACGLRYKKCKIRCKNCGFVAFKKHENKTCVKCKEALEK